MRAIATEYEGIVFRSQFEAICYDYLINTFEQLSNDSFSRVVEYEPKKYLKNGWLPDFAIFDGKTNELTTLIEAKPDKKFFQIRKYIHCLDWCNLVCMDNERIIVFNKTRGIFTEDHHELTWKQAYNNVKAYKG